jgi:hypothetical protein
MYIYIEDMYGEREREVDVVDVVDVGMGIWAAE